MKFFVLAAALLATAAADYCETENAQRLATNLAPALACGHIDNHEFGTGIAYVHCVMGRLQVTSPQD